MSDANAITASLLIEIPKRFPGARCWRNNRVSAMAVGSGGRLRKVSAGIDGQGDISGIFPVHAMGIKNPWCPVIGIRLEVEVKIGRDRMRDSQKAFRDMILGAGGIYIEARSVEQAMEELSKYE